MNRQSKIEQILQETFAPVHLSVENESGNHRVRPGGETHFRVVVVSAAFEGVSAVDRHRQINDALRAEFAQGLHALTIRAMPPSQWTGGSAPFAALHGGQTLILRGWNGLLPVARRERLLPVG